MTLEEFRQDIVNGIPAELPAPREYDPAVNHAPRRKDILTPEQKQLAPRSLPTSCIVTDVYICTASVLTMR